MTFSNPRHPETIVFDIDGVLATGTKEEVYSDSAGWAYEKCSPIPLGIALVKALHSRGFRIVLHTARWESDREKTELWLKDNNVPYHKLVMGKPSGIMYIDDRTWPFPFDPDNGYFSGTAVEVHVKQIVDSIRRRSQS